MKELIIKPIVSEKANRLSEKGAVYTFKVEKNIDKQEIKSYIQSKFNVNIEDIRTMIYYRKTKTKYTKKGVLEGKTKAYKKAIVALKEGQTIDIYNL